MEHHEKGEKSRFNTAKKHDNRNNINSKKHGRNLEQQPSILIKTHQ